MTFITQEKEVGQLVINRSQPVPLYYQVESQILDAIKNGEYKEGDRLPSEAELQKIFGVSITTIKKALSDLVQKDVLYRIQGKGTFVAKPKIQRTLTLLSFTEEMKQKGIKLTTELLTSEQQSASGDIAERLRLAEGESVWVLERLRYGDVEPIALQTSYLPSKLFRDFNPSFFEDSQSLYAILSDKYGVTPHRASEVYSAINIKSKNTAEKLRVELNAAAFLVKRTTYDQAGIAFEYAVSILRGDKYSISVDLSPREEGKVG